MAIRIRKLDFFALASLACYAISTLPFIPREISAIAGSSLCFVLTGLLVASAILPGHASSRERLAAIIACSFGVSVIGGLIINYLPSGVVRFNWLTYALATTLIAYAVARSRAARAPVSWTRSRLVIPTWLSGVKVLTSLLIVTAAVVISIISYRHEKPFIEVWLLPDGPAHSPWHATRAVLGIKSHESSNEDFTVVLNNGKQITTSRVTLEPNQVWTEAISVEGVQAGASVYRGNSSSDPYRTVWIVTQ